MQSFPGVAIFDGHRYGNERSEAWVINATEVIIPLGDHPKNQPVPTGRAPTPLDMDGDASQHS